MELKKNPEANLEKKRSMFFQIGLVAALAVVLVAFEWSQYQGDASSLGQLNLDLEEEEMIPITQQEPPPPPPPPQQTQVIEIVEDDEEIEEELEIEDTEIDDETVIEIVEVQEEVYEEPEVFLIVEKMPSFPGGEGELFKYLGKETKYPKMAMDAQISGTVYVGFVVNEKGNITKVELLRGIGGGCDEEALRVVKNMPRWSAGKQRGKPVRVQMRLPIKFILK